MTDEEVHRRLGVELFNATWDLIDKPDRTVDDDVEMLLSAAASRLHWSRAGGPEEVATGDWQVAHAASLLGLGDVALLFARRNLAVAEALGWDGWRRASAHEGMARAAAAAGDRALRQTHVRLSEEALAREPEQEERDVIAAQLATVPDVPEP
jgi:hypothetical protein